MARTPRWTRLPNSPVADSRIEEASRSPLWLRWVLATLLGGMLGVLVPVFAPLIFLFACTAQAILLKRVAPEINPWTWIGRSLLGLVAGLPFALKFGAANYIGMGLAWASASATYFFVLLGLSFPAAFLVGLPMGTFLGALQNPVLKNYVKPPEVWVCTNALNWGLMMLLGWSGFVLLMIAFNEAHAVINVLLVILFFVLLRATWGVLTGRISRDCWPSVRCRKCTPITPLRFPPTVSGSMLVHRITGRGWY